MRSPRLASVFALHLAVMLGLAMTAYAAAEISRDPAVSLWDLAATHAWHVGALGLLLYATLLIGFERTFAAPLRRVHAHLYRVATGKLELLELSPSVREVDEIVASVNLMVRRMRLGPGDPSTRRVAAALRDVARRICITAPEEAAAVLAAAAELESGLAQGHPPVDAGAGARQSSARASVRL